MMQACPVFTCYAEFLKMPRPVPGIPVDRAPCESVQWRKSGPGETTPGRGVPAGHRRRVPPRGRAAERPFVLTIAADILPQTGLTYLAFRLAFQETLERIILARQLDEDEAECFGFLTEVPFLRGVPAHVQLDLLAETWSKHSADRSFDATLVDEAVVYAACETAARIVEEDSEVVDRFLKGGPREVDLLPESLLASELRALHLRLSNEGDFLMISQFEDIEPDESRRLKQEFGIDESRLESMFDVLGRWAMSPQYLGNLMGLLSKEEIVRSALELGVV